MNSLPITMTKSTPYNGNGLLMVGNIPIVTIAYYYYGVCIGDTTSNYNHTSTNAERGREQRDRIIRFAAYELSKVLEDKKSSFPGLLLVQVPNFSVMVNMFHKTEFINCPETNKIDGVGALLPNSFATTYEGFFAPGLSLDIPSNKLSYYSWKNSTTQTEGHNVRRLEEPTSVWIPSHRMNS